MAVAYSSSASALNLDSTVASLSIPFAITQHNGVVVHIGVRSAVVTVASVTDDGANAYVKVKSQLAFDTHQYQQGHYAAEAYNTGYVEGEVWASVTGTASATKLIVTLTGGAKFAVAAEQFTGSNTTFATAFPTNASAILTKTGSPSLAVTISASASFLSAGFHSASGLSITAGASNTLRQSITGGTVQLNNGVVVQSTNVDTTGATAAVAALTVGSDESVDGISGSPGSPSAGQISIAVPVTYAVCAVEVHA